MVDLDEWLEELNTQTEALRECLNWLDGNPWLKEMLQVWVNDHGVLRECMECLEFFGGLKEDTEGRIICPCCGYMRVIFYADGRGYREDD
jgi:hypothetical protein